jgi:hypothetical protein
MLRPDVRFHPLRPFAAGKRTLKAVGCKRPIAAIAWIGSICSMNRSHLSESASARPNRLKAAAVGFGITVAPVGAVAVTQFAFLPQIVGAIEGLDISEQMWAVSVLRRDWLTFHAAAAALIAVYWLLTAVLGKGQLLQSRAANVTLALFVFAIVILTIYGSFVQWPEQIKGACPFLGISDTDAPFGFDAQSSCDTFSYGAHMTIVLALFGMSVVLLATSAILRIASSRLARPTKG